MPFLVSVNLFIFPSEFLPLFSENVGNVFLLIIFTGTSKEMATSSALDKHLAECVQGYVDGRNRDITIKAVPKCLHVHNGVKDIHIFNSGRRYRAL